MLVLASQYLNHIKRIYRLFSFHIEGVSTYHLVHYHGISALLFSYFHMGGWGVVKDNSGIIDNDEAQKPKIAVYC